jgi:S-adenosylmethionine decarboxylase
MSYLSAAADSMISLEMPDEIQSLSSVQVWAGLPVPLAGTPGDERDFVKRLGRHAIVDVSGADSSLEVADATSLLTAMATACGATLLTTQTHQFGEGHGLTAIAVLAESHISMHEWPEHRFVAFDIFVCGSADPEPAIDVIRSRYPSARIQVKVMERGSR